MSDSPASPHQLPGATHPPDVSHPEPPASSADPDDGQRRRVHEQVNDAVHDGVHRVQDAAHEVRSRSAEAVEVLGHQMASAFQEAKPRLRGWLHAVTSPLTLAAGVVLVALSPTAATRAGSAIFMTTAVLLFTVSAIYHRGTWSPRAWAFLRRFDHANIFLLIAGSYTPFALLMLEGTDRVVLLGVVWGVALGGVVFRIFWAGAPRWLYVPIYLGMGWVALIYVEQFSQAGSAAVLALIVAGGVLYSLGGVVYGLKRPDPYPTWFGFHEVFHTLTILAFITHYFGVSIATYSLR
jgi:hemolysin III